MDREEFDKRAASIARHMPGIWRVNKLKDNNCQHIIHIQDDRRRHIIVNNSSWGHKGMFRFTCGARYGHGHAINCSFTRTDKAIAADVARRLLPDMETRWQAQWKSEREAKRKGETLSLHLQTLERIYPVTMVHGGGMWCSAGLEIRPPYDPDSTCPYGGSYRVEANVSFDQLLRIQAIMAEGRARPER